jgi:hypothetical protein
MATRSHMLASHDEKFSMYELVTNPEENVEEPAPKHFGDMRELLGGEYVANVLGRPDGGAVLGLGTHRYVSSCMGRGVEDRLNEP